MYARFFSIDAREIRISKLIRRSHRWISILFTLSVAANFAAMAVGKPPTWLVYAPLAPLFLLMFSGLYMFALHYVVCGRVRNA
ncbi:MAG: hypothetical protein QM759_12290 [Terricaulis sp.]